MQLGWVASEAGTWNGAADELKRRLNAQHIAAAALVSVDAHNSAPDEAAQFVAFFDKQPSDGKHNYVN